MKYELRRNPRSRNITIRVDSNGTIRVSAPTRAAQRVIDQAVLQHEAWIKRQISRQAVRTESAVPFVLYKGVQCFVRPQNSDSKHIVYHDAVEHHVLQGKHELRVLDLHATSESSLIKAVERFLKSQAEQQITPVVHEIAKKMSMRFALVSYKDTSSRWGSCSSSGTLSLSWRLIQFPESIMRYVVVHELAHLEHMDHSSRFWSLVETFDPDYKQHRRYLKTQIHIAAVTREAVRKSFELYNEKTQ